MKTRLARLALALLLLMLVWPAVAHLVGTVPVAAVALAATHPQVVCSVAAAVLLLGTVPGPVERTLTRLAGALPGRAVPGGGKR